MKDKIADLPIPPLDSPTLKNDLVARRLSPEQVGKVLAWLARQPPKSRVPAAELKRHFAQENFSAAEIEGIMVTLFKEAARPGIRHILALIALGVLAWLAFRL